MGFTWTFWQIWWYQSKLIVASDFYHDTQMKITIFYFMKLWTLPSLNYTKYPLRLLLLYRLFLDQYLIENNISCFLSMIVWFQDHGSFSECRMSYDNKNNLSLSMTLNVTDYFFVCLKIHVQIGIIPVLPMSTTFVLVEVKWW